MNMIVKTLLEATMPLYYQREGWEETRRRCIWGYRRLSPRTKKIVKSITYEDEVTTRLLREAIREACLKGENLRKKQAKITQNSNL